MNCAVNIDLWIFNFANDVTEIILRFIGYGKVHIKMNSNYKQISSNPFEIKLKRNSWHLTATQWWLWAYYCNKQFNIVAYHFHLYLETILTFNFKWCIATISFIKYIKSILNNCKYSIMVLDIQYQLIHEKCKLS